MQHCPLHISSKVRLRTLLFSNYVYFVVVDNDVVVVVRVFAS